MENNLSVILIAHNEESTIPPMVHGLLECYDREILEIIVVDDASTDHTASVTEACMRQSGKVRLVKRTPPCGVGRALKTGFSQISQKTSYVLTLDSDFLESVIEIRGLLDKIENGYDGVIGSRFIEGSRLEKYPFLKKIMNRSFHWIVRTLFRIKQRDLTNNFKLFKKEIVRSLPWRSNDFSMNAETGLLPILAGYKITESPVSWVGRDSQMGVSKFKLFKQGFGYVKVILYGWKFRLGLKQNVKRTEIIEVHPRNDIA